LNIYRTVGKLSQLFFYVLFLKKCKRKKIEKSLNANFYILYISDRMSQKVRLGRQEKVVINFLSIYPKGIELNELIEKFSFTNSYKRTMLKRLQRLKKKGLIIIREEINPITGKMEKRVYLKR